MFDKDKRNRTLTAGQLIEQLSRLNPNLPVVFEARDEPLGDYGVRSLEVCEMQRENIYAGEPFGCDVYHSHVSGGHNGRPKEWWDNPRFPGQYDQPQEVVLLRYERQWQPTIDAEPDALAITATEENK